MEKPSRLESLVQKMRTPTINSTARGLREFSSPQFEQFIYFMNELDTQRIKTMQDELRQNYMFWAACYELLKAEFSSLWNFFSEIEKNSTGWYCVSPSLARWGAVGHGSGGYNFSACIMKNHDREAPNSEKSLTISFAFESLNHGIGDEFCIGRNSEISEELAGLQNCSGVELGEQLKNAKRLVALCRNAKLIFRLNHNRHGQESTRLEINILKEHSLVSLAEKLFMALNNDIFIQFSKLLLPKEQRLYLSND
jgi:hypothetical protein